MITLIESGSMNNEQWKKHGVKRMNEMFVMEQMVSWTGNDDFIDWPREL
jgi:hypothetical protein